MCSKPIHCNHVRTCQILILQQMRKLKLFNISDALVTRTLCLGTNRAVLYASTLLTIASVGSSKWLIEDAAPNNVSRPPCIYQPKSIGMCSCSSPKIYRILEKFDNEYSNADGSAEALHRFEMLTNQVTQ